ncbi:MAG: GNAT family N-acetyltransferase [Clostridiales bacterium]|jgi:ribosomal protein S18 acetylase RimI-like enzyme|nr:GNAT family N-acetyltransferase [Clostridiales bacterium]
MKKISIRRIESSDTQILAEFIYLAIFVPPGVAPLPKETIYKPEIYIYIKDFGKPGDCGFAAEENGVAVGAAWARTIPGYGHVDDETPELAISVLPEHRGQGIGTVLLQELLASLKKQGYRQTSLSVQKANPAARLYQRLGYNIIHESPEEFIMVKKLCE